MAASSASLSVRDRVRLAVIGRGAVFTVRLLRATLRLRFHGEAELRRRERENERLIVAFWHRHLLLMPWAYRGRAMSVLASPSKDGEITVRTMRAFGIDTTRGSSSRGGARGLRELVRKAHSGFDLAFTPDGPRGPAGRVQLGVIAAAALTGAPIFPVAYAAQRYRRLGTWDRLIVPLPFSELHYVVGEGLVVSRDADQEVAGAELTRRLALAEEQAEEFARGGTPCAA